MYKTSNFHALHREVLASYAKMNVADGRLILENRARKIRFVSFVIPIGNSTKTAPLSQTA